MHKSKPLGKKRNLHNNILLWLVKKIILRIDQLTKLTCTENKTSHNPYLSFLSYILSSRTIAQNNFMASFMTHHGANWKWTCIKELNIKSQGYLVYYASCKVDPSRDVKSSRKRWQNQPPPPTIKLPTSKLCDNSTPGSHMVKPLGWSKKLATNVPLSGNVCYIHVSVPIKSRLKCLSKVKFPLIISKLFIIVFH